MIDAHPIAAALIFAAVWLVVFAVAREGSDAHDDAEWALLLPTLVRDAGLILWTCRLGFAGAALMGVILWVTR
jgi:hypothetical protein